MAEGGGEILEGFLCPICKADLGTALQLHTHFQEHTEDQDVLKSLKDLLGKAKKKILKLDDILPNDCEGQARISSASQLVSYNPVDCELQEMGATRSYTESFRAIRNSRLERYAAETNKLLIRLDKLLVDLPTDPVKRKAHEQAVVPWIDDRVVKLCPTCAKNFHVARRKHHCRLCGAVMCHDCTQFLPLTLAKKMTSPAFGNQESGGGGSRTSSAASSPRSATISTHSNSGSLRRSNSNSSLNSVLSLVDTVTGEQNFRLCIHCRQLLDTREKLRENRILKPIISQFYERLRSYQTEADQLAVMYNKMCQSLKGGESTYTLTDAQVLRVKLLKLAENIDSLSNKIAILGTKDVENPPRGKTLQLQQMIRTAATSYLREQLVSLKTLPTEAELKSLQDQRRQEVSARIRQEKQLAVLEGHQAEMQRKRDSPQHRDLHRSSSPGQKKSADQVASDTGWGPEAAKMFDSEDPMIQQMNIIRNYIKQARSAHRYDEVATLEQNLKELGEEYWRQQQEHGEP